MPVRNILVALDGTKSSDNALEGAVAMQRTYDAHLTAFVSAPARASLARAGNAWIPQAIRKTIETAAAAALEKIENQFALLTSDLPRDKIHVIEQAKADDTSLAQAARFFDISVVGIPDAGDSSTAFHPDRIALLSGRPVLAFPASHNSRGVAERALVAWDGSRSAARAMMSSIRLLEGKRTVDVVTVGNSGEAPSTSGLDPQTALGRQGLNAVWRHVNAGKSGIAGTLLAEAEAIGAWLIVMGAYEHSKFREDLFGGVTHDVMAQTRVPVLLAH